MPPAAGPSRPARSTTLAEYAIEAVRAMIRTGELTPGELYSVTDLADRLEVSRSPVREGMLRLAEAGVVRFERNRGFRVLVPDGREVAEIFALRLAIEPPAVGRVALSNRPDVLVDLADEMSALRDAASRDDGAAFWAHDRALHDLLLVASGNRRAADVVRGLREATRAMGTGTTVGVRSLRDIADDHAPIVDAVVAGDAARARDLMARHLETTGRLLVAQALGQAVDAETVSALWAEVVGPPAG